jgi:glycosyltransferase involved in cell wall biosynthesis
VTEHTAKPLDQSFVLIASHEVFEDGAPQALEKYLAPKVKKLEVLLFPFKGVPEERIGRRTYVRNHKTTDRRYRWSAPMPNEAIAWLRDIVVLIARLAVTGRKVDVFVGVDPMNCLVGVIMKKIGLLRGRSIFYTIDYVPKRFGNERLNRLYHRIDEFCCSNVDTIWNVSAEIAVAREERSGLGRRARQVVVPIGVHQVVETPQTEPKPRLVYLGILLEKNGVQYVFPALRSLANRIPGLQLDIIGTGPYEPELRALAEQHGVTDLVTFGGYVKENAEIQRLLTQGGVALATYDPDPNSFTRFADPSKLKMYLAAGLPIILTDVPAIAPTLAHEGCATIVTTEPESIEAAVASVLGDSEQFRKQAYNAAAFARDLLWTNVFDDAFAQTTGNTV